jgi:hypothetical protein
MNLLVPGYCIVAQMGHLCHIGYVTEVDVCGVKMLQVAIQAVDGDDAHEPLPATAVIVAPQSIYNIVESDVESAIHARMKMRPRRKVKVDFQWTAIDVPAEEVAKPEAISTHDQWSHDGPCRSCNGTGKYNGQDCVICDGSGTYEVF